MMLNRAVIEDTPSSGSWDAGRLGEGSCSPAVGPPVLPPATLSVTSLTPWVSNHWPAVEPRHGSLNPDLQPPLRKSLFKFLGEFLLIRN